MKIYYKGVFQYWYDRSTRSWWWAEFDAEGNQIGDAGFGYTKPDVLYDIDFAIKTGVKLTG